MLETFNSEVVQFYLLVDKVVSWTDFRVSQGAEFLGVNAEVGGKIMEGMKMLEGRKRVSSPFCWSEVCFQASKRIECHNLGGRYTSLKHC